MKVGQVITTANFDAANFGQFKMNGEVMRLYVRIARTGELVYLNQDGEERVELVTPEVLFSQDSVDSFIGIPVTKGHPGKVTKDNARQHIRGVTGQVAKIDGTHLGLVAFIHDGELQEDIKTGRTPVSSCGYYSEKRLLEDGRLLQLSRIGNHLGAVTGARAGGNCLFLSNMDSADESGSAAEAWQLVDVIDPDKKPIIFDVFGSRLNADEQPPEPAPSPNPKTMPQEFNLDGLKFETDDVQLAKHAKTVDALLKKLNEDSAAATSRAEKAEADLKELKLNLDSVTNEKEVAEGKVTALTDQLKEAKEAAPQMDGALLTEALQVWTKAGSFLSNQDGYEVDLATPLSQVRRDFLKYAKPDLNLDGKSDGFVEGCFATTAAPGSKTSESPEQNQDSATIVDTLFKQISQNRQQGGDGSGGNTSDNNQDSADDPRKKARQRVEQGGRSS